MHGQTKRFASRKNPSLIHLVSGVRSGRATGVAASAHPQQRLHPPGPHTAPATGGRLRSGSCAVPALPAALARSDFPAALSVMFFIRNSSSGDVDSGLPVADNHFVTRRVRSRAERFGFFCFPRIVTRRSTPSSPSFLPLPFPIASGIIRVCSDLAGLFRNKDTPLC